MLLGALEWRVCSRLPLGVSAHTHLPPSRMRAGPEQALHSVGVLTKIHLCCSPQCLADQLDFLKSVLIMQHFVLAVVRAPRKTKSKRDKSLLGLQDYQEKWEERPSTARNDPRQQYMNGPVLLCIAEGE